MKKIAGPAKDTAAATRSIAAASSSQPLNSVQAQFNCKSASTRLSAWCIFKLVLVKLESHKQTLKKFSN